MPCSKKQHMINAAVALSWINALVWFGDLVLDNARATVDLGLLIVTAALAVTTTVIRANDRRIAKLEQACCALTRLVLEADEADYDRRRHLSAVR